MTDLSHLLKPPLAHGGMIKMVDRRVHCRISVRIGALIIMGFLALGAICPAQEPFVRVPLKSRITRVQPMTGIVLWTTSEHNHTDAIQLEYSYLKYGDVVAVRGQYDWTVMDRLLKEVAARGHQAIIRFYYRLSGAQDDRPRVHQGPSRLP